MKDFKAECPKCGKSVDRVDREYGRHYVARELCTMTRREIVPRRGRPRTENGI